MTTSPDRPVRLYDDFTGPAVDAGRWSFFELPRPDGSAHVCAEPDAVTEVHDGELRIAVETFRNGHPGQLMDNAKHLLISTAEFVLDAGGVTEISGEIAARGIDATPRDYRDGFVSLVTIDTATGAVFDLCASSDTVFAVYEQLPLPGVENPFTAIVEDPLAGVETGADRLHRCRIVFDAPARTVRYVVDDVQVFTTVVPVVPRSVRIGLGLFTLHPTSGSASRSLRGQGLAGRWRAIGATVTPTAEPTTAGRSSPP